MGTIKTCSCCRQPLPSDAPGGLCPQCLMQAALGTGVDAGPDTQADGTRPPFTAPTPAELAPFFPQLEILDLLGRGGMGAVYKARQNQLDRLVAVKILPPGLGDDPAFAGRFTREAKALAKLNHPNIVTLLEFGQTDGLFYFIMEFVDGPNLRQLLEAGRIAPREALAIVPQICDALQYAHDASIVHRDIKPENILLDRQGRVKVADFGLAKIIEGGDATPRRPVAGQASGLAATPDLTEAGKVMGTPQYMAPEQTAHPSEVDHRADIYSLGVVFYQMLTGELPAGQPFAPPSRKVLIDVRLDEVVLRALEKEPERRYQQVSEVKTMVETIGTTPPPAAVGPEQPKGVWQSLKAGKPAAEWEGRAPGWRIGCRSCGFTEHWGKYGIRMAAAGRKWTVGRCECCHRIRIHVIEKGPVSAAQDLRPGKSGSEAVAGKGQSTPISRVATGTFVVGLLVMLGAVANFNFTFGVGKTAMLITGAVIFAAGCIGWILTARTPSSPQTGAHNVLHHQPHRFSLNAIVGACCAGLFFLSVLGVLGLHSVVAHSLPLKALLLLVGTTAPFATTILGWVAVSQIRRSAGRLCGLGLALFDALLFPLLALDVLIGLFWSWIVYDLIRASIIAVGSPVSAPTALFVKHASEIVMLFTVPVALLLDYFLIRRAWRAVRMPVGSGAGVPAVPSPPNASAVRFGLLALGLSLVSLVVPVAMVAVHPLTGRLDLWSRIWWIWIGVFVLTGLFGLPALIMGIIGWKSRAGKAAVMVTALLPLLVVAGGVILYPARNLGEVSKLVATAAGPGKATLASNETTPSFGPVIERVVADFIDLDSGKLLQPPDSPHPLKAQGWQDLGATVPWMEQQGVDATWANEGLIGVGMTVIPLANDKWEDGSARWLLDQLAAAAPQERLAKIGRHENLPVTYGFKTREGGVGILQFIALAEDRGLKLPKIRYKMVSPQTLSAAIISGQAGSAANPIYVWCDKGETEAILPHGGRLRLLAVGDPEKWWTPQGQPLPENPEWQRFRKDWPESKHIAVVAQLHPEIDPAVAKIGPDGEQHLALSAFGISSKPGERANLIVGFGAGPWQAAPTSPRPWLPARRSSGASAPAKSFTCCQRNRRGR